MTGAAQGSTAIALRGGAQPPRRGPALSAASPPGVGLRSRALRIALLHGLARSSRSLRSLERTLDAAGHDAFPVDYGSRRARLRDIAVEVAERLSQLGLEGGGPDVGFVCHSMGGLVLRALPTALPGFSCGRSVLLGSPIHGSILAERLRDVRVAQLFFGPALSDLGPEAVKELPLPPGPFACIAGDTWSPLLPGAYFLRAWAKGQPSDSTVLVEETRSPAAADHLVVHGVHTFLARDRLVQQQVLAFLATGAFLRATRAAAD